MNVYALTFPQLVRQAMEMQLGNDAIARMRVTYDLAEHMADGLYRSQGCPFINHLVRTSSIVLAHGGGLQPSLAAMLHSAYMLDCFHNSRRRAFRPGDRAQLSAAVGIEVEEIVSEYHRLGWGKREIIATHLEQLPSYNPVVKSVLLIRLANELEDYLDLAVQYRPRYSYRNRIDAFGGLCIDLAERLGMPGLGLALREAYDLTLMQRIPAVAVREYINAYELPRWHFNERNMLAFAIIKVRMFLRKLNRSGNRS
ncbi:MAG: hypothetical protein IPK65_00335 [Gammaproteobacteria bacterium]|nr:hypothetical protein [Gammaproteobacteria bacterium]